MVDVALWAMSPVKGLFLQDNAIKTCETEFPTLLSNHHKCLGGIYVNSAYTHPICQRMSDLEDDVGFSVEELK